MKQVQVNPIGRIKVSNEGTFIELDKKFIPAIQALDGFSHIDIFWWFSEFDS